jgi:hypothetical protein
MTVKDQFWRYMQRTDSTNRVTKEDLEKYGLDICLLKAAMEPEEFEQWYAEELARWEARSRERGKANAGE